MKKEYAYKPAELKKLQQVEIDILTQIIKLCDRHNIKWFAYGGTELGAVRHSGFIPWDDDIDIGMLRTDYERFLKIAAKELPDGYSLTYFKTDKNCPTYYAKVRRDGTEFVEYYTRNIKMHHGIFVDVMPFDCVPDDPVEKKTYYKKTKFWNQLYIAKTVTEASMISSSYKWVIWTMRHILHLLLLPVPKAFLYNKTKKVMTAYNGRGCKAVASQTLKNTERLLTDIFPTVPHKFDNITVMLAAHPDVILKNEYGDDYMTPPPVEKRYSHAPIILKFGDEE